MPSTITKRTSSWLGHLFHGTKTLRISQPVFWLMCASFFCLSEIDRISGKNTVKEAQELRKGYQGSIRYADCAQQSDAAKIRQEIDEHIDEAKGFCGDCCVAWWMSYEMKGDAEQFASRTSAPVIKGAALMAKLLNLMEFPLRNRCCFWPAPTYRDWPQEDWTLQCCFRPLFLQGLVIPFSLWKALKFFFASFILL